MANFEVCKTGQLVYKVGVSARLDCDPLGFVFVATLMEQRQRKVLCLIHGQWPYFELLDLDAGSVRFANAGQCQQTRTEIAVFGPITCHKQHSGMRP